MNLLLGIGCCWQICKGRALGIRKEAVEPFEKEIKRKISALNDKVSAYLNGEISQCYQIVTSLNKA